MKESKIFSQENKEALQKLAINQFTKLTALVKKKLYKPNFKNKYGIIFEAKSETVFCQNVCLHATSNIPS